MRYNSNGVIKCDGGCVTCQLIPGNNEASCKVAMETHAIQLGSRLENVHLFIRSLQHCKSLETWKAVSCRAKTSKEA